VQIEQPDAREHWTTADMLKATNIVYYIDLQPIDMNVMRGDDIMQVVPGLPISLRCQVNLIKWFNAYSSNGGWNNCMPGSGFSTYNRNDIATMTGGVIDDNGYDYNIKLSHPFISRSYHGSNEYNSVCMGDNTSDINRSFFSNDMISFFHNIHTWLSVFTPGRTGPINPVHQMHIGIPEDWDDHYADIVSYDTGGCDAKLREKYKHTHVTMIPSYVRGLYCDDIKCKLRSVCNTYSRLNQSTNVFGEDIDKIEGVNEPWDLDDSTITMESLFDKIYQGRYPTDGIDSLDRQDLLWLIAHGHYGIISRIAGIPSNWMEVEYLDKYVPEGVTETEVDDQMKKEMEMWADAMRAGTPPAREFDQTHTAGRDDAMVAANYRDDMEIIDNTDQFDPDALYEQLREIEHENRESEDE
jgi:hypothetical protein